MNYHLLGMEIGEEHFIVTFLKILDIVKLHLNSFRDDTNDNITLEV